MTLLVAMMAGTLSGVLAALIPGLHLGLALALLLGMGFANWVGLDAAGAFIATSVGSNLYTRRLGAVYHPSAGGGDVASLDPALRLTSKGRGPDALRLMVFATDLAWGPVVFGVILLGCFALGGFNAARDLDKLLAPLAIPLIGAWVLFTVGRSRHWFATLFGFAAIGLYGYTVLHHPGLKGNEHALAPMMAGLFGIPIMLAVWQERGSGGLKPQHAPGDISANPQLGFLGTFTGLATGFFAGLGAGSLVTFFGSDSTSNEDYLLMTSASEASNDLMAVLLVLVAGMGRSGEAVLLGRVLPAPSFTQALLVLAMVAVAAYVGRAACFRLERVYITLVSAVPTRLMAVLVIGLAVWQVVLVGQPVLAFSLTAAGVCLSLWARSCKLPLQVSFAGIALPLVVQGLGLAPALNLTIFGV